MVHSVDDVWGWVDPETGREFDLGRLRGVTAPPVTFEATAHYQQGGL